MTPSRGCWSRRCGGALVATLALCSGRAGADTIAADKLAEAPLADAAGGVEGAYLAGLHADVHRRWTGNFLRLVGEKLPAKDPLNDPARAAEIDVVVAADGQLTGATVARSSGFAGFDDAAVEVLRDASPFSKPPVGVRSDDDKLHARWVFARDQRRCAGLTVQYVYDPVDVSVPHLLRAGRRAEALRRIGLARAAGQHVEPQVTLLANDWIKSALRETWATPRLARLLAERGDADAIAWLKAAVRRPDQAADAGAALTALKLPVCPLVKPAFDGANTAEQQAAAAALVGAGDAACAPGLVKLLTNTSARPDARAAAARALGSIDDDAGKKALAVAAKEDAAVPVRAAAMLAQIKPDAGRPKVIAMVGFLRDPAPEIRATAAAGVIRAGGDTDLDDLYVLFKDSDPRPALATLREIERVPSEEATKLVARLARRPQPAVEKAAADSLVQRGARSYWPVLKQYVDPKTDPAVRAAALVAADDAMLLALASDAKLGVSVYRARLERGEPDQAADWLVAYGSHLPAAALADAMTDWAAWSAKAAAASAPTASAGKANAPKSKR